MKKKVSSTPEDANSPQYLAGDILAIVLILTDTSKFAAWKLLTFIILSYSDIIVVALYFKNGTLEYFC